MQRRLATVLLLATLTLLGCGSNKTAPSPTPLPTVEPTLPPQATSLTASLEASCNLSETGAEFKLTYGASGRDGMVTRVKLLRDGSVIEDSGSIAEETWRKLKTIAVDPGNRATFEVQAESVTLRANSPRST